MNETWKPIPGYENYECSNEGRFRRIGARRVLGGKKDRLGYVMVGLVKERKQRWFLAHRVVAAVFMALPLNDPNKFETVNHKNRVKNDNRVDNLEVITMAQNSSHWRKFTLQAMCCASSCATDEDQIDGSSAGG